jgi:ectoine hydroxylase-related dioxygenase (phytanoyl-CoA dioxygenase family)
MQTSMNCITAEERDFFEEHGYLILPKIFDPETVAVVTQVIDAVAAMAPTMGLSEYVEGKRMHIPDILSRRYVELGPSDLIKMGQRLILDLACHDRMLPKIWGVLGWHIALIEAQLSVLPPGPKVGDPDGPYAWHQDGGYVNPGYQNHRAGDYEPPLMPRLSMKAAVYFSDTHEPDCGQMWVIPRSHRSVKLMPQYTPKLSPELLEFAIPLRAGPGSVVLHDRRTWHAFSPNKSQTTRKIVFLNYGSRWLEAINEMDTGHLIVDDLSPVAKQLLRTKIEGGTLYPEPDKVPLYRYIVERMGVEALQSLCPRKPTRFLWETLDSFPFPAQR